MKALDTIREYRTLWALVLPHITTPGPEDVARWCDYPTEAVEHAILRTAKRFAREKVKPGFDPLTAYKYATATARSIAEQTNTA